MTLFPSPTRRCLLPSFPFHVRWKSLFFSWLWKETLEWVIVDMKVFVAFLWLTHSLHLTWRPRSLICVAWTRHDPSSMFIMRTGRCSFALPPLPTTSWDLLETSLTRDAFPWSLWRSVTCSSSFFFFNVKEQFEELFRQGVLWEIQRSRVWQRFFFLFDINSNLVWKHLHGKKQCSTEQHCSEWAKTSLKQCHCEGTGHDASSPEVFQEARDRMVTHYDL